MEGDGVGVGLVGRGVGGLCEVIKCEVIKKGSKLIAFNENSKIDPFNFEVEGGRVIKKDSKLFAC